MRNYIFVSNLQNTFRFIMTIQSNKYKNIIFDLGGVLLNIDYDITARAFEKLGISQFHKLGFDFLLMQTASRGAPLEQKSCFAFKKINVSDFSSESIHTLQSIQHTRIQCVYIYNPKRQIYPKTCFA